MIPDFREDGWLPVGHHAATWDEILERFQGISSSRRAELTNKLIEFRDALRKCGVTGYLLLNGSYISSKPDPRDFDLLLVGPPDIQAMKELNPILRVFLDAEQAERKGYSLFYVPSDSPALASIETFWDYSKEGVAKGCIRAKL